ncbi:hypothetical protein ACHWQZ_G016022 [Mnemiopsis leidyi]
MRHKQQSGMTPVSSILSPSIDGDEKSEEQVIVLSIEKEVAWRCPTKCPCHAYLTLTDNSLTLGSKPDNHPTDNAAPLKREVLSTLKKKAAEFQLLMLRMCSTR